MQVNRIVWRNVYDVKGVNGDISYNGNAGAEILHHYLTRYAIAKKRTNSRTVIWCGRLIRPITPVAADWRATAACVRPLLEESRRGVLGQVQGHQLGPGVGGEKLLRVLIRDFR
jgi:hypothetical protein